MVGSNKTIENLYLAQLQISKAEVEYYKLMNEAQNNFGTFIPRFESLFAEMRKCHESTKGLIESLIEENKLLKEALQSAYSEAQPQQSNGE